MAISDAVPPERMTLDRRRSRWSQSVRKPLLCEALAERPFDKASRKRLRRFPGMARFRGSNRPASQHESRNCDPRHQSSAFPANAVDLTTSVSRARSLTFRDGAHDKPTTEV